MITKISKSFRTLNHRLARPVLALLLVASLAACSPLRLECRHLRWSVPDGPITATVGDQASVEFTQVQYKDESNCGGPVYFMALMRNTGTRPIVGGTVVAVLKDQAGKEVTRGGMGSGVVFKPGETQPIGVWVNGPAPNWTSYDLLARGEITTTAERLAELDSRPNRRLELVTSSGETSYGHYVITGTVRNPSDREALYVSIDVAAFDSDGQFVGEGIGFTSQGNIAPHATDDFQVDILDPAGPVARYEITFGP